MVVAVSAEALLVVELDVFSHRRDQTLLYASCLAFCLFPAFAVSFISPN